MTALIVVLLILGLYVASIFASMAEHKKNREVNKVSNRRHLMTALDKQEGGSHYKNLVIQPMEYSIKNNLDALQHTAIKYITRHHDKNGKEDILKAMHTLELILDMQYTPRLPTEDDYRDIAEQLHGEHVSVKQEYVPQVGDRVRVHDSRIEEEFYTGGGDGTGVVVDWCQNDYVSTKVKDSEGYEWEIDNYKLELVEKADIEEDTK